MRKRVLLSWSGGKDSALALQALRADPIIEVAGLLTSVTRDYERISVHGVRRSLSDGPGYDGPVEYTVGETVLRDERFAYCDLIPVDQRARSPEQAR